MIESKNLTDYPEIMTVYDLGEYFDVSYPTALKWLKNNMLPTLEKPINKNLEYLNRGK